MATVQRIIILITQCGHGIYNKGKFAVNDLQMQPYLLIHGVHAYCWVPWPLEQQAKGLSSHQGYAGVYHMLHQYRAVGLQHL